MNLVKVIGILALLFIIALTVALTQVGKHTVNVWAEQSNQPQSATDLIMSSRRTVALSPESTSNADMVGAGLLAIALLLMGLLIFFMRSGSDLLRQWRLTKKQSSRQQQPKMTPIPQWSELPPAPYLLEVEDEVSRSFD